MFQKCKLIIVINRFCSGKLETSRYASGPTWGPSPTYHAKFEKNSISRAIQLRFLRSLVNAIRCEANKSNRRRWERPVGSRAVKMLGDMWWRARGLAQHMAAANARAKVRARTHNWSIWCQGSSRQRGCVMAHSKTLPARGEPNEQNSMCGGGILIVQAIQLGFSRSLGSATSHKSAMLREE